MLNYFILVLAFCKLNKPFSSYKRLKSESEQRSVPIYFRFTVRTFASFVEA